MPVSFAIQAHPRRAHLAEVLAGEIGGEVEIVFDPEPDSDTKSPWRTYRRLLELTPDWSTHRFQIQDDALVCPGLRAAVERAVHARPDRLLVFFVPGDMHPLSLQVLEACARDEPWAELWGQSQVMPCVATCWPVGLIDEFLVWVDAQDWRAMVSDDNIIARWCDTNGIRVLASVPSLVEHPDLEPSLIGLRTRGGEDRGRVAACWIGDCVDCAEQIDWTR